MNTLSFRTLVVIFSVVLIASCSEDSTTDPTCTVGATCDDGDNTTINDKFDADCDCVGTATDCTGIGDADGDGICTDVDCNDADDTDLTYPSLACDDGNADTENDVINGDCECEGECTLTGDPCDDDDDNTYNDEYNEDCDCEGTAYGSFTDPRDSETYRTVQIGTQSWMAENLNYTAGGTVCYAGQADNCNVYGRLYGWTAASTGCPVGWHLPDDTEWDLLRDFLDPTAVGDNNNAGGKMKEAGTAHWNIPNTGATNSSGFTGLPGGFKLFGTGEFGGIGTNASWWSATEDSPVVAWHRNILFGGVSLQRGSSVKADNFSVRCIQD